MSNELIDLKQPFSITLLNSTNWKTEKLGNIIDKNKKHPFKAGMEKAGVYIFWWSGDFNELKKKHLHIQIKGKHVSRKDRERGNYQKIEVNHIHKLTYNPEWLTPIKLQGQETEFYPLYVGKSTNVLNRLGLHLKLKTKHTEWRNSILKGENCLNNDALNKENGTYDPNDYYNFFSPTTSCQFRAGMELMCLETEEEDKFCDLLKDNIHFSFLSADSDNKDEFVEHRFYLEDYLIGALRPWFNLDSER